MYQFITAFMVPFGFLYAILTGLLLCAMPVQAASDYKMTLYKGAVLCGAPTHVAIENGYFAEEGIQYDIIQTVGQTPSSQLIAAGKIEASMSMLPAIGMLINNGFDCRIVMGVHKGCLAVIAPAGSPLNSMADLKGKKIGVPALGSTPMLMAQRALTRAGINANVEAREVEYLPFSNADLPLAMQRGLVDAIAVNEPNGAIMVQQGLAKVIFSQAEDPQYKDEDCCVLIFNTRFVEKHPDKAVAYARAMIKGIKYIRENPTATAKMQLEKNYAAAGNVEINSRLLASYNYEASYVNGKQSFRNNLEDLQNLGLLNKEFNIDALVEKYYISLPGLDPDVLDKE